MPVIDPTTDIGKLRLKVSDFADPCFLPDDVYAQTLTDCNGNMQAATRTIAMYILGILSQRTHRKLVQLEIWGGEAFKQYKEFITMLVTNPSFNGISPIAYYGTSTTASELVQFPKDWKRNYYSGTESQQLATDAENSPNSGDREYP